MRDYKKWSKNIHILKEFFKTLPSKGELDEILKLIKELIEFLKQIETSLSNLPTSEEAERARNALERLSFILEHNQLLKNITSQTRLHKQRVTSSSIPEEKAVVELVSNLFQLPEEKLREVLNEEKYSKKFLLAILLHLGRKVPSKISKKQAIEQIITHIITKRTYEGLMGKSDKSHNE